MLALQHLGRGYFWPWPDCCNGLNDYSLFLNYGGPPSAGGTLEVQVQRSETVYVDGVEASRSERSSRETRLSAVPLWASLK